MTLQPMQLNRATTGQADCAMRAGGGMGLLLRTKRHTATGKQIQVLVAAVNRHMPATPSKCCRRRRVRCARLIRPFMIEGSIVRCMIPALAGLVPERGKWRRPRLECVRLGRPLQSVATQDGCPPPERPPAGGFWDPATSLARKKRCASVPAVNGPKTLQNQQGFSRFGRPKSAPIVHRKHAGTVPLPHHCRAATAPLSCRFGGHRGDAVLGVAHFGPDQDAQGRRR